MMILKMSSRIRSSCGRRPVRWLAAPARAICSILIRGPYQVAVVLGRGKLAKIEVALTRLEEYQVKLLGDQLRKEGACRGLDIRAAPAANFVSRLSEFQTKDQMLQWIEEMLAGERALKAETARERRRRGEGNSPAWRRGGPIGG